MASAIYYLAALGLFMASSLIAPVLIAVFASEFDVALRLMLYLALGVFLFVAILFSLRGRHRQENRITGYLIAVLIWVVTPIYAAVPLADIAGMSFLDAVFETVSGLTTTGASVIRDVEQLPKALIFWRSQVQWTGGLLTLLTVLLLLAPSGIGGLPANHASSILHLSAWTSRSKTLISVIVITRVYLATTAACFVALVIVGEQPFVAITLSMMALSTGGLLPQSGDLLSMVGQAATVILALFLVVGATSIFWQRMVLTWQVRELVRHRESYAIILVCLVLALVIASLLYAAAGSSDVLSPSAAMIEGMFNAASLISTNGVETREGVFALLPVILVVFLVIIGGGTFSTSGGMKYYRMGGMLGQSLREIRRLIYPNAVSSSRIGSQAYSPELLVAIWSYFTVAILSLAFFTVFLNLAGLQFNAALMATVAAFSNVGPLYNSTWVALGDPAWPAYADMAVSAKIALMILMILGRLEILVVLGVFNIKYWMRR